MNAFLQMLDKFKDMDIVKFFARFFTQDTMSPWVHKLQGAAAGGSYEATAKSLLVWAVIIAAVRDDDGLPGCLVSDDERADAALERHLKGRPLPEEPKALQRLGMYLVRRGFSPDTARAALRRHAASR